MDFGIVHHLCDELMGGLSLRQGEVASGALGFRCVENHPCHCGRSNLHVQQLVTAARPGIRFWLFVVHDLGAVLGDLGLSGKAHATPGVPNFAFVGLQLSCEHDSSMELSRRIRDC